MGNGGVEENFGVKLGVREGGKYSNTKIFYYDVNLKILNTRFDRGNDDESNDISLAAGKSVDRHRTAAKVVSPNISVAHGRRVSPTIEQTLFRPEIMVEKRRREVDKEKRRFRK